MSIYSVPSFRGFSLSFSIFLMLVSFGWCCHPVDRAALSDFSNALDLPVWPAANGSDKDCCLWYGIICSNVSVVNGSFSKSSTHRVVSLILRNMTLGGRLAESLGSLSYLRTLSLRNLSLSGPLPHSLGRLTSLQRLELSYNHLSGPIPEVVYQLSSLEAIELVGNSLSGPLSSAIGNLSGLSRLAMSGNQLSGIIPDVFHGFKNLRYFVMDDNHLSGQLPASFSTCSNLELISVEGNNLSGRLEMNFTVLPRLGALLLGDNSFSVSITKTISSCKKLRILDLSGSKLQGSMPWEFFPPSLMYVGLHGSRFFNITTALLSFQQFPNLIYLEIRGTFEREAIPADGIIGFANLQALIIADSKLVGVLPMWLSRLDKLVALDLSGNYMTGEVPTALSQLKSLRSSEYRQDALIVVADLAYSISIQPTFDLSNNMLSGSTWIHLSNLTHLVYLDLSHNSLTGSIPADFSKMSRLEYLNLSWNYISGTIPPSLKQLSYLSHFCVANNMLHGDVPTGSQFSTFPSDCFEGNMNLCYVGKPRCYSTTTLVSMPDDQHKEWNKVIDTGVPLAIGVSIGYATAFLVGVTHYCWTWRKQSIKFDRKH